MMKSIVQMMKVVENRRISADVFMMKLEGDTSLITMPGTFINIKPEGFYLRRPISVYDVDDSAVSIVYKTVGEGTAAMAGLEAGVQLDVMVGLGNGFDVNKADKKPLLIGGGVGAPPLYLLAKRLLAQNKQPRVVLGFNSVSEVILQDEFTALGIPVEIATVDGSCGTKGFVTDLFKGEKFEDYYYACGPLPMLRAVYNTLGENGELSFESRMGCGFGACMGCSMMTKNGAKRVCADGPVFDAHEVIFE